MPKYLQITKRTFDTLLRHPALRVFNMYYTLLFFPYLNTCNIRKELSTHFLGIDSSSGCIQNECTAHFSSLRTQIPATYEKNFRHTSQASTPVLGVFKTNVINIAFLCLLNNYLQHMKRQRCKLNIALFGIQKYISSGFRRYIFIFQKCLKARFL